MLTSPSAAEQTSTPGSGTNSPGPTTPANACAADRLDPVSAGRAGPGFGDSAPGFGDGVSAGLRC